jgi:hypothetical protein
MARVYYLIRVYPSIDDPAEEVVEDMSQPFSVQHAVKSSHKDSVLQKCSILKLNKNKFANFLKNKTVFNKFW